MTFCHFFFFLPLSGEYYYKFCLQHCMLLEPSLLSFKTPSTFLSYGGKTTIQLFFLMHVTYILGLYFQM